MIASKWGHVYRDLSVKASGRNRAQSSTVLSITRQCIAVLARGINDATLDSRVTAELEHQLGRFKIWAGTLGVFAAEKASADYRLRNDEDVKEVMIDMLLRLKKETDNYLKPVIAEEVDDEDPEPDSSQDSEASLVLSIDDQSEVKSGSDDLPLNYQMAALSEIEGLISKLYRLAAIIRKPTSTRESTRVANFIEKAEDSPEMAGYESHVRWQVKFRLPDATGEIAERLVGAIVFRRRKLQYRERHQKKLSQGLDRAFQAEIIVPNATKAPAPKVLGAVRQSSPFLKAAASVKSSPDSALMSGTEASSINKRGLAAYPRSIAPSNVTKSAVARRDQLDVPQPPKGGEDAEAICPYCFEVVDKKNMSRTLWTRHILRDIDPYVCLFEGCSLPNEQYQTFDEWISHMKWQHTLVWSCQAAGHSQLKFDNPNEAEAHMQSEHKDAFSQSQLKYLAEKSAQPADDPLEVITRVEEGPTPEHRSACPLCPFSIPTPDKSDKSLVTTSDSGPATEWKVMRDHITAHLEAIALLSLPEQDNLENAASDEVESQSARNSRKYDSHISSASYDITEGYQLASPISDETLSDIHQTLQEDAIEIVGEELEDWSFLPSTSLDQQQNIDPRQDPILAPFIKREQDRRQRELLRRLGIPMLIITDPDGAEVPFDENFDEMLVTIADEVHEPTSQERKSVVEAAYHETRRLQVVNSDDDSEEEITKSTYDAEWAAAMDKKYKRSEEVSIDHVQPTTSGQEADAEQMKQTSRAIPSLVLWRS